MASEAACRPSGKRPCKMQAFRIWDTNQKTFYLRNNQLIAGYLQGPNIKLEEKIDMVPIDLHSVFLGIHGGKLCLSCAKSGDDIKLQLEEVNITDLSKNKEEDKRFTFIRSEKGPTTSFEPHQHTGRAPYSHEVLLPGRPIALPRPVIITNCLITLAIIGA